MPDDPRYDPDRMVVEDLDLSDPEVVRAYLYHPTTQALAEDKGRQFRELPAAQQRATLDEALRARRTDHAQISAKLEALESDDPARVGLQQVLEGLAMIIEAMTLRLHELDDA